MNLRPSHPEEDALFDFGHDGRTEPVTDLEATLSRLQRVTGSGQATAMPTHLKHQTWEDIMHAHAATPAGFTTTGQATRPPLAGNPNRTRHPASPRQPWAITLNALMAAALVLAITGGLWRIAQNTGSGPGENGPEPSSIPFGSFVQDDGSIDPAELPTADDCTVEPLTVDEVLWYVTDTYEASYSLDMENIGPMPTEYVSATPPATNPPNHEPGHASQQDLDAAASTQVMLTACVLADSYFQAWALLDPWTVANQVEYALPPLTGVDEARAILEDLEANGPADADLAAAPGSSAFPPLIRLALFADPSGEQIWMLGTNPENSWQNGPNNLTAGYATYNLDGSLESAPTDIFHWGGGTPVTIHEDLIIENFNCS
ncbi:MAG TPA: hypothetical protein VD767_10255, partial [Thermomicrobiales bacterium]|nr:hypothetical protein [Thermomicrobiales bacterium]